MSLQRNEPDTQTERRLPGLVPPQTNLESLWQKVMLLRESDRREAEDKYQVSLLLATTEKLCRTLTDFMTATESELLKMRDEQMKLLNVQEQYKDEIRDEVIKILTNTYSLIKEKQQKTFDDMTENAQKAVTGMEEKISSCTEKCEAAAKSVDESVAKMRRIECLGDWLFFLSPLLVIGDVVLRLIELFVL